MALGGHNFDAQSHQQLYDKIHKSVDPSTAQAIDDAWNNFRAVMGNAKAELESAIRSAGAVWVGSAGEQFTGSTAPLVQWAEDARVAGVETHKSFQAHQSHYLGAKNRIPEPVQVTSTANDDFFGIPAGMTHLVGGQTDQDVEEQKSNEAKREAVRVMKGYDDGSSSAVNTLGAFTPPPQITTEVAEPKFDQPPAQRQYSQQFADGQWSTTSTSQPGQWTPPQQQLQQPVNTPPTLPPAANDNTDNTDTSAVQPPVDVRPGPTPPITPPVHTPGPTPQPPTTGPVPPPSFVRPNPVGSPSWRGGTNTGAGTPKLGSGLTGQPGHAGQQVGRGPAAGVGSFGADAGRGGAAMTGARGAAGASGAGGMAGGPQRGQGDEDTEHKTADYLEELRDVWGEDDLPMVAPPVIGDDRS
jgi:hypothetical protein